MKIRAFAAAAAVALLAGCGGGSTDTTSTSSGGADTATSDVAEPSETAEEFTGAAQPEEPTYDGAAVALGQEATINGAAGSPEYKVTALGFEDNVSVKYDDQSFLGLQSGQHWGRIKGKVCATIQTEVSWVMWQAVTADGTAYKYPDAGFTEPMRGPLFPEFTSPVPPGQCRTGYVYVALDKGVKVDFLTFTGTGAPVITWKVP